MRLVTTMPPSMTMNISHMTTEAPRQIHARAVPSALTRLLPPLDPSSRLSRKILRILYGKRLKHMINMGTAFHLQPTSHPQIWDILWQGKKLGETSPFPEPLENTNLWLLATGPSVNDLDLTKLRDQSLMGINGAIAICAKHRITPTYYASTDYDFFDHRMPLVKEAIASGAHCFFSFNGIARICRQAPEMIARGKISLLETVNRYYGIPQMDRATFRQSAAADPDIVLSDLANSKVGWSHDVTKGVFASNTIAYSACQIASHLHARHVFILGMDLGSGSGNQIRAYETGDKARPSSLASSYEKSILPAFSLMASLDLSTQFWNLSAQSRLPAELIPKISFDQALSNHFPNSAP